MIEDIKKAIEQNLPSQVSQELQSYLKRADEYKKSNESLTQRLESRDIQMKEKDSLIEELKDLLSKHEALDNRESAIRTRENNIKVEMAELRADLKHDQLSDIKELVNSVFRNPTIVHSKTVETPVKTCGCTYDCSCYRQEQTTERTQTRIDTE